MDLSIVIPIYNEGESIAILYEELVSVCNSLKKPYEIIIVDDGSTDNCRSVLDGLLKKAKESSVRLICIVFRKNFGKSQAIQAGFREARGGIVITLDGDLQDDPNEIPKFISKINEGYDLVSGWKFKRKDPLGKTIPSKVINAITSRLTGIKLHDFNCCFKAYRHEVIEELKIYGELHRYIPALVFSSGFRIAELKVYHRPRKYGESKYGFKRFFEGFFDLITVIFITKFIKKPLHFFGNFGLLSSFLGFSVIIFLYVRKFLLGIYIGHNPYLFLLGILLIVVGFQFFSIGLLGELMVRVNSEETQRSHIREIIHS